MARIRELLNGRETFLIQSEITARDAAEYMLDKNVGAVPVVNGSELVGVDASAVALSSRITSATLSMRANQCPSRLPAGTEYCSTGLFVQRGNFVNSFRSPVSRSI